MLDAEMAIPPLDSLAERFLHNCTSLRRDRKPFAGVGRLRRGVPAPFSRAEALDLPACAFERDPDRPERLHDRTTIVSQKAEEEVLRADDRRAERQGLFSRELNGLASLARHNEAFSFVPVSRLLGEFRCNALGMFLVDGLLAHTQHVGNLSPGPARAKCLLNMQRLETVEPRPKRRYGLEAFVGRLSFGDRKGKLDLVLSHAPDCNPVF